jgi:O-antigen ligase
LLLLFSQARAGILAGTVSCFLLCVALRKYRVLIHGMVLVSALAVLSIMLTPGEKGDPAMPVRHTVTSTGDFFLYKGHKDQGLLGSRESPWQQTVAVIRDHPWFGSGFGTSLSPNQQRTALGSFESPWATTREHGNSYLAILEWVGLLGVVPFIALLIALGINLAKMWTTLARTRNVYACSVPVAAVVTAGLIHAAFEDWLFAVGYYLCVFFWVFAFELVDLLPRPVPQPSMNACTTYRTDVSVALHRA